MFRKRKSYCTVLPPALALAASGSANVKVLLYVKVFRTSLFSNPSMDLVHVWCDDRYWSKILWGTIPTPVYDLKVKITDIEFYVKVLR